jgi:DNA-binding NtrC family response regulator
MLEKSIIVVDDDHDILNLFHHYLKNNVKEIDLVHDPERVMERLQFKKYDLVVTDILMPKKNGIDLTKEIKSLYPNLPILVCSEGGTTNAKEIVAGIVMNKAITFGAIYALKKPFKKKELLRVIEAILLNKVSELND